MNRSDRDDAIREASHALVLLDLCEQTALRLAEQGKGTENLAVVLGMARTHVGEVRCYLGKPER